MQSKLSTLSLYDFTHYLQTCSPSGVSLTCLCQYTFVIISILSESGKIIHIFLRFSENPSTSLSQASIVGMTVGITILVTSLAGFLVYKKFGLPSQWRYTTSQSRAGVMSMSDVTSRPSNGSGSSEDSANSFNSDSTNTTVRFTS